MHAISTQSARKANCVLSGVISLISAGDRVMRRTQKTNVNERKQKWQKKQNFSSVAASKSGGLSTSVDRTEAPREILNLSPLALYRLVGLFSLILFFPRSFFLSYEIKTRNLKESLISTSPYSGLFFRFGFFRNVRKDKTS